MIAHYFLAGGITGCPNWQKAMVKHLSVCWDNLIVFNPRRDNFPINDPGAAKEQIEWEHDKLSRSDDILFWFPCETLCPITLYELGAWSMSKKPVYIGVHPDYARRQDVEVQTALRRPEIKIVYTLEDLAQQYLDYFIQ